MVDEKHQDDRVKASFVQPLRQRIEEMGPEYEAAVLKGLTAEDVEIYKTAMATRWLPPQSAATIMQACASVLYPQDPRGLERVGALSAELTLKGVYKIFTYVLSPEFILDRAASMWHLHYKRGKARVEKLGAGLVNYTVEGYPELHPVFHRTIAGFIKRTAEIHGAKNVVVNAVEIEGDRLSWRVSWS